MTLDTERLWNWHHHGTLWNFYRILRNIAEQLGWIAASAWPSYNPAAWQHLFFFRTIWCFISFSMLSQKKGAWIIFNPTCIMLNIQSIISCNLYRPSLFFAHTFGLQLGWSRSKVCQDAVYFQAAAHQLLHTVFGEETKNGLDPGKVNEGQFSCGHFYWSLIRLVSYNYNRSVRSYWYIYKCHEISTYLSREMSWSSLLRILLWKSEIVSSAVAVDHRTSKRHWSN